MSNQYASPPPGLPAGARVWAYLRDSGGPAQERSVDQQEQELRSYCKRHGLNLVRIFQDAARSGGSVIGRAEFMLMIDLSEQETDRPTGLLIWNFARFSRDSIDSNYYKALLRKRGIIIHSLTDAIPTDDFAGRIVETILDLANEEKRRQTSRDVKRGLKSLLQKGYAPGVPPRGYVAIKVTIGEKRDGMPRVVSKWDPDPVLAELVKLAWQLRAQGKSYAEITKATGGKLYTATNSWPTFFKNKAYLGIGKSGDLEVADHHEPLITWELWEAVQNIHEAHPLYGKSGHLNHPRRVGNPTILSGFTYCLECGAMMTHSPGYKKQPWPHYICGKKARHGVATCTSKRIGANSAENQILAAVLGQVLTHDYLMEAIDETKKRLDSTPEIERQIVATRRKLEEVDIAIHRIRNTIERTGAPSADDWLMQREAEKAQLLADLEKLQMQLRTAQTEITPEAADIILAHWRTQFERLQSSGNVRELKAWLLQFVSRIELGYYKARVFYTYPVMDLFPRDVDSTNHVLPLGSMVIKSGEKFVKAEWSIKHGSSQPD